MSKKNVCRILPLPRGEYSATETYDVLDFVQKGTALYQSKKPGNKNHPVTDTAWWALIYDTGAAIDAALSKDSPATEAAAFIARLMAIDKNGQAVSITPAMLVDYVLESLLNYDIVALTRK